MHRRRYVNCSDSAYLSRRLEQSEAAALAADRIEVIQAHATMALHYRALLDRR